MKFIHTSDWHIGRLFQNISLLEDQMYVLRQLKEYVIEHNVDALVIAGDVFDRAIPPAEAVDALDNFLHEIVNVLGVTVILISGNHDSAKRLRFGSRFMQESGIHILSLLDDVTTPVVIDTETGPVHFYGIPYHNPVEVREAFGCEVKTYDEAHTFLVDLIKKERISNIPSVLISHCFIDGADACDSERPLSIGGADRVSYQPLESFDYVALGHLHGPQYKGEKHIRYSGSLLKYSFSEYKQKKGISLVEMDNKGLVSTAHLSLKPKHDLRVIEETLENILKQGETDENNDDYIFARLTDEHDILDPLGQLRQIYPNTLLMERTKFIVASGGQLMVNDLNVNGQQRKEEDVFKDFFAQVIGHELTEAQNSLLLETINEAKNIMEAAE